MTPRCLLIVVLLFLLGGCAGPTDLPDFEGRWRKYESPNREFIEFKNGQVTMGDDAQSEVGSFSYRLADESEPLYQINASFPSGSKEFQLYYERDTISLMGVGEELDGLYEIIFDADPIQAR